MLRDHGGVLAAAPLPPPVRHPTPYRICERYDDRSWARASIISMETHTTAAEAGGGGGVLCAASTRQGVQCPARVVAPGSILLVFVRHAMWGAPSGTAGGYGDLQRSKPTGALFAWRPSGRASRVATLLCAQRGCCFSDTQCSNDGFPDDLAQTVSGRSMWAGCLQNLRTAAAGRDEAIGSCKLLKGITGRPMWGVGRWQTALLPTRLLRQPSGRAEELKRLHANTIRNSKHL